MMFLLAAQITCVPYLNGASLCRWDGDGGKFQIIQNRELVLPKHHSWMRNVLYASLVGEVAYFCTHTKVQVRFKRVT